jgi:hypothetical protein
MRFLQGTSIGRPAPLSFLHRELRKRKAIALPSLRQGGFLLSVQTAIRRKKRALLSFGLFLSEEQLRRQDDPGFKGSEGPQDRTASRKGHGKGGTKRMHFGRGSHRHLCAALKGSGAF